MGFVVGIVLLILSIPVLWVNERRHARMQSLISLSRSDVSTVSSKTADSENRGKLVYLCDGKTDATVPVANKGFPDVSLKDCLRLKVSVEVYQWIESVHEEHKKNFVGGGTHR